jgi:hypothetical protein
MIQPIDINVDDEGRESLNCVHDMVIDLYNFLQSENFDKLVARSKRGQNPKARFEDCRRPYGRYLPAAACLKGDLCSFQMSYC